MFLASAPLCVSEAFSPSGDFLCFFVLRIGQPGCQHCDKSDHRWLGLSISSGFSKGELAWVLGNQWIGWLGDQVPVPDPVTHGWSDGDVALPRQGLE